MSADKSGVFLTVDRRAYDKAIQVSINLRDAKGGGHGHRLLGPKYDGNGTQLAQHKLTTSDAKAILEYITPLLEEHKLSDLSDAYSTGYADGAGRKP